MRVTKNTGRERASRRLHMAVANWLKVNKGSAVVTGTIRIISWPEDPTCKFDVAVGVLGRKPSSCNTANTK